MLNDRLTGQSFLPDVREWAGVAQCFAVVGALVCVGQGRAASGAGDAPSFSPMLGDRARCALTRVPIRAGPANLRRPVREINSADPAGASMNVIAMSAIGSRRSFSDRRASCANPSRWSRTERLLVPSISHLAKNGLVTP